MAREFPKNPEPQKVVPPTVGRIVYVFSGAVLGQTKDTPMAAIVTGLRDGLTIDACVFSGNGVPQPTQGIAHITEPRHVQDIYWDWMPYQKGQAAKTEELERLKGATGGLTTGMKPFPDAGFNEGGAMAAGAAAAAKDAQGKE